MSKQDSEWVAPVLAKALAQLEYGDEKYGPHPGPRRALGALKNEVQELETEINAENSTAESVETELVQVIAMGLKAYRFWINAQQKAQQHSFHVLHGEKKTSAQWLEEMKDYGLKITDPSGWRLPELPPFYEAFNVQEISLTEFLRRLYLSSYNASIAWQERYEESLEAMMDTQMP